MPWIELVLVAFISATLVVFASHLIRPRPFRLLSHRGLMQRILLPFEARHFSSKFPSEGIAFGISRRKMPHASPHRLLLGDRRQFG